VVASVRVGGRAPPPPPGIVNQRHYWTNRPALSGGCVPRLHILVLLIGLCWCVSTSAADQFAILKEALGPDFRPTLDEVRRTERDASKCIRNGDFTQAARLLDDGQKVAETLLGPKGREIPLLLTSLAEVRIEQGELEQAEECLTRALEIARTTLGDEHPVSARLMTVQADLRLAQGKLDEALSLCGRSLSICEKAYGKNHLTVGLCLCEMGSVYGNQYKTAEALAALQRSRSIIEQNLGPEHFTIAEVLANLSSVYREDGNYRNALVLAKESLRIREDYFGSSHLAVADSLYGIGWVHLYQQDYAEADRSFERALTIVETTLGENHRGAAACLDRLAESRLGQGDYAGAVPLLGRGFAIKIKVYGKNNPITANSFETLGQVQQALGNYGDARNSFGTCLQIRLGTLGREHPSTVNAVERLGSLFLDMHDYTNALASFEGTLMIREKVLGREHPHVAVSLAHIADFWYRFGQTLTNANPQQHCIAKAAGLQERAVDILQGICGAEDPEVTAAKEYLAAMVLAKGDLRQAIVTDNEALTGKRKQLIGQLAAAPAPAAYRAIQRSFVSAEIFQTLCAMGADDNLKAAKTLAAEQLALDKALLEEVHIAQAALDADPRNAIKSLREEYGTVLAQKARLPENELDPAQRDNRRRELEVELSHIESDLAMRVALVAQTVRERNLKLADIAWSLPPQSALVDVIQYRHCDFTAKTNQWKEKRYAAYLTFPLARDSTNVLVERVDLGESAPINEAVEFICKRMSLGGTGIAAKDLSAAWQRLSESVYAPLARHLTNVSHLIVCPDGQLSRVPFEMLRVGDRFLIEEKTISYVTSGREIVRLQSSSGGSPGPNLPGAATNTVGWAGRSSYVGPALVMGGPDFDLDLSKAGSSRREEALAQVAQPDSKQSLLTSAATRTLSREYRGIKFPPLPGAEAEAGSVAKLLGGDCVLRVGSEAREAELKAAVSPRVLHLATHGFFLSDQEFRRTNALRDSWIGNSGTRWNASLPKDDWENPLVRCGIALAGANHVGKITNAVAEDGILTGLEASLLNLQGTELVILSACDSGTGEVKIGEGVMSLRRAFRIAGAQTVLASHWKVSDKATSQLMTEFIRRWRSGEPRAKAWREAQLSLLHSKEFASPYFWAAFTLTGKWN
jgi:CHAT domain-containing protein